MTSDLFRKEVMDAHKERAFGGVVLVHPTSHYVLALMGFCLFIVASLFLVFGQYTRHVTVPGVLEPKGGLVKVYAGRTGQLKTPHVQEGQFVHKGDVLLILTSEHNGVGGQAIEDQSEALAKARLDTLRRELEGTNAIGRSDETNARESLAALRSSQTNLQGQIANQSNRVKAAEALVVRYEELQKSGFMPEVQVQEKRNDLTDQQVKLQMMTKDLINVRSDIGRMMREVVDAPVKAALSKAQIERNIAGTEAELGVQQNAHDWSVTAPCDGVVSGLVVKAGQSVDATSPIMTIVPSNDLLQATLYAPSSELGFIKSGQQVKIKLDSFPYQKFGLATGSVIEVASSPVLASEMSLSTRLMAVGDKSEPLYAIKVSLDKQTIDTYGKTQPLRPGMQLGADVELDVRRLYEWILEPLLSVKSA